jgi:4-hydroxybenzoate polyprenyltransferase
MVIAFAFFCGQLVVGWSNDLIDYQDDLRHNRLNKPLVAGLITPKYLQRWLQVMIPIAILVNLFGPLGFIGGGLSLFAVGWAVAYNFYFKFNFLSPLPYAVAFAALPSCIALSKDQIPPLWMWLGGALFGVAAHFLNVIKDMKQDNQSGIKGLPQRVGTKASVVIAIVLIASAIALLALSDLSLPPVTGRDDLEQDTIYG